jgi:hypothetical protein
MQAAQKTTRLHFKRRHASCGMRQGSSGRAKKVLLHIFALIVLL